MRKLILISAFVLASVSAQAGQGLARLNDPVGPAPRPPRRRKPDAATETKTEASKPHASKSAKKTHARTWRDDEAEARRIAAKYGVYW